MTEKSIAAIIRNECILMVHMVSDRYDFWTLPGGGIEPGETPEQAVIREVKEETNMTVSDPRLLFVYGEHLYGRDLRTHCFIVDPGDDKASIGVDPELAGRGQVLRELCWKPIDCVRDDYQVAMVLKALEAGPRRGAGRVAGGPHTP